MKNLKRAGILLLILVMVGGVFAGCASKPAEPTPTPEPAVGFTDGTYVAEAADFDAQGWKDSATVTITGGKISAVVLNGTNKDATLGDKLTAVKDGKYDMTAAGAIAPWDVQAKAIQDYIVTSQDTTSITFDDKGKSDAISGATISYGHFFDLVNEALSQAKPQ